MNKQYYYGLLLVVSTCLLLSLVYCPLFDFLDEDRGFFRYTGMAMLHGQVPYRDFFDQKPPMIFLINFAGLLLGSWGLWLINTSLALLTSILFYRLCRQYRLTWPWLLPLLFNLMIRDNLISCGTNYTREYTTFFLLLFFCILLGKYQYRYFWAGLLTALTFFTQQEQVLALVPFLLYALFANDSVSMITRIIGLSGGFLSVTLPLLLYFALHRGLGYFWDDAFVFNMTIYIREKKTLGDHFRTIKRQIDTGNYELPFMISLILGTIYLFRPNKKKSLVGAALLAVILSMSSEWMGGRLMGKGVPQDFSGYFLPLSASVCILLFTVFAFSENALLTARKAQLPYALLLCSSLIYTALQHTTHLVSRDQNPFLQAPALGYLRQQKVENYQLYVFFDRVNFYNQLNILAPSPWVYQHPWEWYSRWDPDHAMLASIAQDLMQHRTRFIIMDPQTPVRFINPANRDWWMSFMATHYKPVLLPNEPQPHLWELKN